MHKFQVFCTKISISLIKYIPFNLIFHKLFGEIYIDKEGVGEQGKPLSLASLSLRRENAGLGGALGKRGKLTPHLAASRIV